ncbi:hypothetical protein GPJ56_007441 [Histomonas meleagridis]|uniref:uncharacterized protein n=1 Tax=Histomonas meleagridis TaxID=135588 RepID=UPI003559CE3C|nr:hypothetical protein GPJ56_007441 [Histomonas meleagridis]KAH0804287.1 hypothetical protein GO595_003117 [Histomonas meleagridis]
MLSVFILQCRFIPMQWATTPNANDTFHKFACKGWSCFQNSYLKHQEDEFNEIIEMFQNYTINETFPAKLFSLLDRGYEPAYCAIGLFEMIGFGYFEKNLTSSYNNLIEGSKKGMWSCNEALSFHPFGNKNYTKIAASQGAIWSMFRLSLETSNATESLDLLMHLATISSYYWWKRRLSGPEYSDAISVILGLTYGDKAKAWKILERLTDEGNLPSAIWKAEGLRTGEIGRVNVTEAIETLKPFISSSRWMIDLNGAIKSNDKFDLKMVIEISSLLGNSNAKALLSFPYLFE